MVLLTEHLPSSSSTHNHDHIYDVFLSFRGVDTRKRFTSHLYKALREADINTFLDDEEIETGKPLKPELESAIKSSRASIIVLSPNYASSTWCLDELVLILEQQKTFNQILIPIFYDVEPTDVRKQQNSFGEAMAKHAKRMEAETNTVKRSQLAQKMELWKMALTQVANLKGIDAKDRMETELIEEIVNDINNRLGVKLETTTLPQLIGMHGYINSISSWLTDGSCDHVADILTIVGIGGIGKTSLAKYVFQLHSSEFHRSSFVEGITTRCNERFNGLLDLQKQLHTSISRKILLQVNDVSAYTSKIENVLSLKRVLIVLDDIGSLDQLDALLGKKGLHPGSKIIITTKDASLTLRCALFNPQVQSKHTMVLLNGLYESASLELLCIHAFKRDMPEEGYESVSKELVRYCDGHPLALEVLGRSLQKRDVAYWEECLRVLKKEPHFVIKQALQMSFHTLPSENDKDLFKHIACFFVGIDKDVTQTILNACDINTRSGLINLVDRCLLRINSNNELMMHQLVQEMGKDLVRQESPDKPWKRSRLCCHSESFKVLKQQKGHENLLGLSLDMRMLDKNKLRGPFELKTNSLSGMDNLMLLQLNYVQLNGFFENIPEELRWLCIHGFPLKSIHLELPMENLVALDMSYSIIESFDMSYSNPQQHAKRQKLVGSSSKDKPSLRSLKILDLSFCEQLRGVGGFFELPALERLIVKKCISLVEVCESVEQCVELVLIDLRYCCKLNRLPLSICKLKKLKILLLDGCNSPESQVKMWDMNSWSTSMEAIPNDLKFFAISLPTSLIILSLANINLSNDSFPMDFSCLSVLKELYLDNNPIVSMPNCVRTLPRLEKLSMDNCETVISIEHPPHTLRVLSIDSNSNFIDGFKTSLRKVKFHQEMSPLRLIGGWTLCLHSSFEFEGVIKVQPMAAVEEKVVHSLGWTNVDFTKERHLKIYNSYRGSDEFQTQMYYEFGIFSTLYEGEEMPSWISYRSVGASIEFTIPSSPNNLRGLNFCCLEETDRCRSVRLPLIKISNITTNRTWIYDHYVHGVDIGGKCMILLSHWLFGPNEMKSGDHITIDVAHRYSLLGDQHTRQCGINLLYDENGKNEIEEEEDDDTLGYYKSWNHIIGGDLSAFQLTTGEYILHNDQFLQDISKSYGDAYPFVDRLTAYKEQEITTLKAFSQK